jgi:hypothetical protein
MFRLSLLALVACAHVEPQSGPPSSPPVPLAIRLEVHAGGPLQPLVPETERRVRERLSAQGHTVTADAPATVEIEIVRLDRRARDGTIQLCAELVGRVRQGQSAFAAIDVRKERCDVTRLKSWAGSDPVSAVLSAMVMTVDALSVSDPSVDVAPQPYVAALDELTDALGRQAVQRD